MSGGELLHHAALIKGAVEDAEGRLRHLQDGLTLEEFAVEMLVSSPSCR